MLAGVGMEIDERIERYNDMLWRPYALFPPFCHICLRHCAYRNVGHPLSPVFIFTWLGIRCNDLARYPWRMPRGVCSWYCAMQGGNEKAAASFIGMLMVIWICVMCLTRTIRLGKKIPLYGIDWIGLLLWEFVFTFARQLRTDTPLTN